MMQISESHSQKNSLFNAMNRFLGAVNNMDQTVMVPSLLRDVPVQEEESDMAAFSNTELYDGDMFSHYELLKSIRADMQWGVRVSAAERRTQELSRMDSEGESEIDDASSDGCSVTSSDCDEEDNLQKQFQYHLTGLQEVLSKLTRQADTLTNRYKQEIGAFGGF